MIKPDTANRSSCLGDRDESHRRVSIVLFDGFELLDVFGPVGLLGMLSQAFSVELVGPASGLVRSSQGAEVVATVGYRDAKRPDIVLVPGGRGTRSLVNDAGFLEWLAAWASEARLVTSVCTGAAVLAAAGLLDGFRATTNKRAYGWATSHGSSVEWVAQARWVEDRSRWTSSGVAAGIDMTAALVAHLFGPETAAVAAAAAEIEIHTDPHWDPFAAANGLF
ncbi:DJ-1/PfpI family protein [Cryobacterium sp. Y11]|uniref:DJ-1/PfpI family protein n=1 Tax=Cryobacterium sp. Y11 TaxID=2045016 RepID=UPI002100A41E|nr:DJ-1/PfpI family protein [Cryobacterium sp. Y11]